MMYTVYEVDGGWMRKGSSKIYSSENRAKYAERLSIIYHGHKGKFTKGEEGHGIAKGFDKTIEVLEKHLNDKITYGDVYKKIVTARDIEGGGSPQQDGETDEGTAVSGFHQMFAEFYGKVSNINRAGRTIGWLLEKAKTSAGIAILLDSIAKKYYKYE